MQLRHHPRKEEVGDPGDGLAGLHPGERSLFLEDRPLGTRQSAAHLRKLLDEAAKSRAHLRRKTGNVERLQASWIGRCDRLPGPARLRAVVAFAGVEQRSEVFLFWHRLPGDDG